MNSKQVLELVEDKLRGYETIGLGLVELECQTAKTYQAIISQRTIIGWGVQGLGGKVVRFNRLK